MKKIEELLEMENGILQLNEMAQLNRWQEDALGDKVDRLTLYFADYGEIVEIKAREPKEIIEIINTETKKMLEKMAREYEEKLNNGYIPYEIIER